MAAEQILKLHNLKNTGCRKHIINELLNSESALSENEIKNSLPDIFDRVTFYRSLKTLEENNIIHKIVLDNMSVKYALNRDSIIMKSHPHFHCIKCDKVLCIDAVIPQKTDLPDGFSIKSATVLLEGTCSGCEKNPD